VKPFVVEKAQLGDLIDALSKEYEVFGPAQTDKGYYDWQRLDGDRLPEFNNGVTKSSIKTFFFPQPEVLFEFKARANEPDAFRLKEPQCDSATTLLFGVRPCDARSVTLNSMPYANDPYFQKRVSDTVIIGLLCSEGCSTCFCKWIGGSPTGKEGMDVAAIELDDVFFLEPISEKGQQILENVAPVRSPLEKEHEAAEHFLEKAKAQEGTQDTASTLRSKELMHLYEAGFWKQVSEPCINCGTCTFLCPTCYCFDIQDETLRGKGRRIRYWDSCMFPLFTQHASGHNPRGDKLKRVRNRFMHKLKYFPDRFGPVSCVGCGRCVRDCPVNIDIRQVLRTMLEL